jgi:hypothetical protein
MWRTLGLGFAAGAVIAGSLFLYMRLTKTNSFDIKIGDEQS